MGVIKSANKQVSEIQTELSEYFDINPFVFNDSLLIMLKAFKVQPA